MVVPPPKLCVRGVCVRGCGPRWPRYRACRMVLRHATGTAADVPRDI